MELEQQIKVQASKKRTVITDSSININKPQTVPKSINNIFSFNSQDNEQIIKRQKQKELSN